MNKKKCHLCRFTTTCEERKFVWFKDAGCEKFQIDNRKKKQERQYFKMLHGRMK
jgi:hypothetical protein